MPLNEQTQIKDKTDAHLIVNSKTNEKDLTYFQLWMKYIKDGSSIDLAEINRLISDEDHDWNTSLPGAQKGITQLHLYMTAVFTGRKEALTMLHKVVEKENLNWNIKGSIGVTPLCLLMRALLKGFLEDFHILDRIVNKDNLDWNSEITEGPLKGCTPLYFLILAASKYEQCLQAFEKLISRRRLAELNFDVSNAKGISAKTLLENMRGRKTVNEICTKHVVDIKNKINVYVNMTPQHVEVGMTSLHLLLNKVILGDPEALALLEKIENYDSFDWNAQIRIGKARGTTPLHILIDAARGGNNQAIFLLDKIANNKNLKWNVPFREGKMVGATPLHLLLELMTNPSPTVMSVLNKVTNSAELDWNAQIATEPNLGKTPFYMLLLRVSRGNAAAIAILNKLVIKDDFDWNEEIKIGSHKGRTHLFMLIGMASRDFICWQALENLISRRSLAELNFDVTDVNGISVKELLNEQKQATLALWIRLKKATQDELITDVNTAPSFNSSKINGGVAHKYQAQGSLAKLPHPPTGEQKKITYTNKIPFITLFDMMIQTPSANDAKQAYTIDNDGFSATLFSTKGQLTPDEQIIFIFAGRKRNALLPRRGVTRCVLVLTVNEYQELEKDIPSYIDVLVLENITSKSHGFFDKLHLLTARRIGVFLTAHHLQLNHFLMIDDNIKHVQFQSNNKFDDTDEFYALLKQQVKDKGCVNVSTYSFRDKREGELGSKLFLVNMELIRQKLPLLSDMFLLFPGADETLKPLEDYYFQTFLHVMLSPLIGYQILPQDLTSLKRSQANLNACASLGMMASNFDGPKLENFTMEQQAWLRQTLEIINRIIVENAKKYEKQQRRIKNVNLGLEVAKVHALDINQSNIQVDIYEREGNFIEAYQADLKEWQDSARSLYPYQLAAMKAVANQSTIRSCVEIPTGCGKSMLLYMLASIGFSQLNKDEIIAVVTPQIGIANQLYDSFVKYHANLKEQRFPVEKIMVISSDAQCISIKLLKGNNDFDKRNHIAIFCMESFERFCKMFPERVARTRMVLLDECHKQQSVIDKLDDLNFQDALIIGSSATPCKRTVLGAPIYRYTFKEAIENGYLAPIIADSLGTKYSKKNVNHLINCLPLIFKTQNHPGYKNTTSLASNKGMVFLPGIPECQAAANKLENANIPCFIINTDNKDWKKDLENFTTSKEAGVILAVRMLEFGFNFPKLSHIIIGKKISSNSKLKQLIGRPVRNDEDKVAYVLTFEDIKKKIDRIFRNIPHTRPACGDYLGQHNSYYFCENKKVWQVCDTSELPKYACATFTIEPSDDYSNRQDLHFTNEPIVIDTDSSDVDNASDDSAYDLSENDEASNDVSSSDEESDIEPLFKKKQSFIVSGRNQSGKRDNCFDTENQKPTTKSGFQKKARR